METKKRNNAFGILAGILFIIYAIWVLIPNVPRIFSDMVLSLWPILVLFIALIVTAIGFLADNNTVKKIGLILLLVIHIYYLIPNIIGRRLPYIFNNSIVIVSTVFLLLACFKIGPDPFVWGILSALLLFIGIFIYEYMMVSYMNEIIKYSKYTFSELLSIRVVLQRIVLCLAFLFAGFSLSPKFNTSSARTVNSSSAYQTYQETQASSSVQATDTVEKLVKLKELLDKGIITQEDFNSKKKEILGL